MIKLVDLDDCADSIVEHKGEGLNIKQRKRLTISMELAARPELLLFLDEPTSGPDSQTSWAFSGLISCFSWLRVGARYTLGRLVDARPHLLTISPATVHHISRPALTQLNTCINWLSVWKASPEYQGVRQELERLTIKEMEGLLSLVLQLWWNLLPVFLSSILRLQSMFFSSIGGC